MAYDFLNQSTYQTGTQKAANVYAAAGMPYWQPNTQQAAPESNPVTTSVQTNNVPSGGDTGGGNPTTGSFDPTSLTQSQRQSLWEAAGHGGEAPVGYGGESGGGGGGPDLAAQARNDINSGYDAYFGSLGDIADNYLPDQRAAQEGIAESQFRQGSSTLGSQYEQTGGLLDSQQAKTETRQQKTLRDLSDNIRNSFRAGNVYLGARGAGDSSASNQYAYALTQLGNKQRGDINSRYEDIYGDIDQRRFNLKNTYDSELNNITETKNQQILSIASWFSSSQQQLSQARAQGQLSRGQDLASLSQNLLNAAIQQTQLIQTNAMNRRNSLDSWAMSNSSTISQLQNNIKSVNSKDFASFPNAQPLTGQPQLGSNGNFNVPAYGGGYAKETDMFGNPIR